MSGDDKLPTEPVTPEGQFDFAVSGPVGGRSVDHVYAGWRGAARIGWSGRPLGLEISASPNLGAAVVYVPKDGDSFCFEPVPHINNALHLPRNEPTMPVITPGESFRAEIVFRAVG